MAHYKRGRSTTRKELSRIEHKSVRQAERQALDGGNIRTVRGFGWGYKLPQPPISDGPVRNKSKKAKRKPKEVCPKRPDGKRQHQYLTDTEILIESYDWYWLSKPHRVQVTRKYKLCVWCGKEKVIKSKYRRL